MKKRERRHVSTDVVNVKFGHKTADCRSKAQHDQRVKEWFYATSNGSEAAMRTKVVDLQRSWYLDSGCTSHLCREKGEEL